MQKIPVIMLILDDNLHSHINNLNLDVAEVVAVISNSDYDDIPTYHFADILSLTSDPGINVWLICGASSRQFNSIFQFLTSHGILPDNIIDFYGHSTFSANLNFALNNSVDFFVTGDFAAAVDIDVSCFNYSGVNLASHNQTLADSFNIAKSIIPVQPNLKFVIITLPLKHAQTSDFQSQLRNIISTSISPDTNFKSLKSSLNHDINSNDLFDSQSLEYDFQLLDSYIQFCRSHNVIPIVVKLPTLDSSNDVLDLFFDFNDLNLNLKCFSNRLYLNLKGAFIVSSFLNYKLHESRTLPIENILNLTFDKFYLASQFISPPRKPFRKLQTDLYKISAQLISKKSKINVAFVLIDDSMWSGDRLYFNFANNPKFNVTVYLCLPRSNRNDLSVDNFNRGVLNLKAHNINVVAVTDPDSHIPHQDVLFFLTPYLHELPNAFNLDNLDPSTLTVEIPYGFPFAAVSSKNAKFKAHNPFAFVRWLYFQMIPYYTRDYDLGVPYVIYSGCPKLDPLVDNSSHHFHWKMDNPIKIVYAPHWSFNAGIQFSTFHLNYEFFLNFAKSHQNISWVFKPHPNLFDSAVSSGLFTADQFNEYLDQWNNLPNAQVVTGAYYQDIFATSDALILDSNSFVCEYMYTLKPILFLTRDSQNFCKFGQELLDVLYTAHGSDFAAISKFIENLSNKSDPMFGARKEFFDQNLNYFKHNNSLASDFIYNHILRELDL